jgi:peroxiredoxin
MTGGGRTSAADRSFHGGRRSMGVMAMTELRRPWRTGHFIIVVFFAVPGVLLSLRNWGYLPGDVPTEPTLVHSRALAAPDFSLPDLDGNSHRLASFRGKVVLLHFWAAWCPPCRAAMPSLEDLYQAYKHQGFEVLAVASDVRGAEVVQPFVIKHHLTFLSLQDPNSYVTRLYGVTTLPTTYVLDREGRLVTVEIGSRDWATADARALIASLVDAKPQAARPQDTEAASGRLSGAVRGIAVGGSGP